MQAKRDGEEALTKDELLDRAEASRLSNKPLRGAPILVLPERAKKATHICQDPAAGEGGHGIICAST